MYGTKGAKSFLDSKGRNSGESKKAYGIGLLHLQSFLETDGGGTLSSVVQSITGGQINVYTMLNDFVSYLIDKKLTPLSIRLYMSAVKAYLEFYDIDIVPSKFKRRVTLPKVTREDEEAIDGTDIRKIVLSISHRRLKAYVLCQASGAMRPVEGLATRIMDIDFTVSPTKIHIRKEYAKTRVARDIYISDEATQYLKQWIDFKYRDRQKQQEDLVFAAYEKDEQTPKGLYYKIDHEFAKVLDIVGLGARKEGQERRKITLVSLRRHGKGIISDQAGKDYSEWFLGHSKSSYWTKKEPFRRNIYATKCMKYLTFLDYTILEATGKGIENQLAEKDERISNLEKQIQDMNKRFSEGFDSLQDQLKLSQQQRQQEDIQTTEKLMNVFAISDKKRSLWEKVKAGGVLSSSEIDELQGGK